MTESNNNETKELIGKIQAHICNCVNDCNYEIPCECGACGNIADKIITLCRLESLEKNQKWIDHIPNVRKMVLNDTKK